MRGAWIAFFAGFAAIGLTASIPTARGADVSYSEVARGKYLTDAGDCVACHTSDKDKPFAGARAIETPFGVVYSANLTPDDQTGIGAWSEDDFYNAMHYGHRPTGERLYPAFPYPYFTRVSRADANAIYAYLRTLEPIRSARHPPELTWPLNYRVFMRGWNLLFFEPGEFTADPEKSAEWNRGAYLVEGLGHCGACHTRKNLFGADKSGWDLRGGEIQHWFAPKLVDAPVDGLHDWTADDIVEFLKTGRNRFDGASGLMAEVIEDSTSKLNDSDLHAIAVYLKDQSGQAPEAPKAPSEASMTAGKAIFDDTCAACHQTSGEGVPHLFPPLKGNASVQQRKPTSVVRVILEGTRTVPTKPEPTAATMPAFGWKLSDDEAAAVASYVRNAWGNKASAVTPDDVKDMRHTLHAAAIPSGSGKP